MRQVSEIYKLTQECGAHVAARSNISSKLAKQCHFTKRQSNLNQGRVSVTPTSCEGGPRSNTSPASLVHNRRLRCPRASKPLLPSGSPWWLQLARSKKKKLLLLSRWKLSRYLTSSNLSAGRTFWPAPQNSALRLPARLLPHSLLNDGQNLASLNIDALPSLQAPVALSRSC